MRPNFFAAIVLAMLPVGPLEFQLTAQTSENVEPIKVEPTQEEPVLRGVMILRISESYLKELFARDINKQFPVQRVVLGTVASGTAHTTGRASVNTKPNQHDAAFELIIRGTTSSRTVGRNGPAIIHSQTTTDWTCRKTVRFEGEGFTTSPVVIESRTRIVPLGAGSVRRGLRGLIVRRIASRRAIQSNSVAERIVNEDTKNKVKADVERVIEQKIAKLNDRVESRSLIGTLLPKLSEAGVKVSTSSNYVNIIFGAEPSSELAKVCPVEKVELSDTQLWIHTSLITGPKVEIPDVVKDARQWLAPHLPTVGLPALDLIGKLPGLPVGFEMIDDWIVVRSATPTLAANETRVDVP